ncbi:MAG: undecaprenyl-diphosphate phosphatase [Alphaproteobacteria bacterium]
MGIGYILILSIIQGLTEFLPVSSSAHLALAPKLFGERDQGLLVDAALHLGTLLAVLIYYRKDLFAIIKAVLQGAKTPDPASRNLGYFIALASIPVLLGGLALEIFYPDGIRDVTVITCTTLVFGLLLGIADWTGAKDKELKDLRLRHAMMIGFAQMLALIPGTSRSGITITTGRLLGFNRVDAARFAFLIGIPATAAASVLSVIKILMTGNVDLIHESAIAVCCTFVAGIAAIHFMMKWLNKFGLMPFVVYRLALGGFLLWKFVLVT